MFSFGKIYICLILASFFTGICDIVDDDPSKFGSVIDEPEVLEEQTKDSSSQLTEDPIDLNITDVIKHSLVFPDYPNNELPAGLPIRCAVTFINNGDDEYLLKYIGASFYHQKNAAVSVQNFSATLYDQLLQNNVEVTQVYNFWPHHAYSERTFYLVIRAYFMGDKNSEHYFTVYNSTHTFQDLPGQRFDLHFLLILIIVIGLVAVVVYLTYDKYFKDKLSFLKDRKIEKIEVGTRSEEIDYSWLPKETTLEFGKSKLRSNAKRTLSKEK